MHVTHPRLSRELALLAASDLASNAVLADMAAATARSSFDWGRFANLATAHAMGPIAGARLAQVAPGMVPEAVALALRSTLRDSVVAMLAQTAAAAALSRRLGATGIRSIVLKGVALSHLLYAPNPEWRQAGDIDVLVAPEDFERADRLLREAGYQRDWPHSALPEVGLDMLLHLANVFTYTEPGTGQMVELHHRISLNPYWLPAPFDELYAATVEVGTASGPIRGLDGPLAVSYLAWHSLGHDGYRLKWFCDIVRALRRAGAASCGDYLVGVTTQTSLAPLRIVDGVIAAILGTMGGGSDTKVPIRGSDGNDSEDAARIVADLERPSALGTVRTLAALSGELANLRFLWRLSPSREAKAYQLLRSVTDPRDVYTLRLSRRFWSLYVAVGPLLAVGRLLGRGLRRPE